jgi:hypothetical protein
MIASKNGDIVYGISFILLLYLFAYLILQEITFQVRLYYILLHTTIFANERVSNPGN